MTTGTGLSAIDTRSLERAAWLDELALRVDLEQAAELRSAAADIRRRVENAPVSICADCDRPTASWPMRDCDAPEAHVDATFVCPCGDALTVEQAVEQEWKHRRCNEIGDRP